MSATKTTKGLLGTKLGMTQVWDENNKLVPGDRRRDLPECRDPDPLGRRSTATPPSRSPTARSTRAR